MGDVVRMRSMMLKDSNLPFDMDPDELESRVPGQSGKGRHILTKRVSLHCDMPFIRCVPFAEADHSE
jgi:hypothetical protein